MDLGLTDCCNISMHLEGVRFEIPSINWEMIGTTHLVNLEVLGLPCFVNVNDSGLSICIQYMINYSSSQGIDSLLN